LRAVLPCEVRVTAVSHPLFDRMVSASGFKRWGGVLQLVIELPDGSPGTIRADATDILGGPPLAPGSTVLSVEGFRRLHQLVVVLGPVRQRRGRPQTRK
jgi:hypothetical protein